MKEYDQETLQKLQHIELQILEDFLDLCNRHGLQYFGYGGTGIGALRHKGFIPWDDDIDIALPRKDYDLFLKYAAEELSDKYFLMNCSENSNYPIMTTRLMKKGTKFREHAMKDIDCPFGIFLDIFPFDNICDNPVRRTFQGLRAFVFSKLLILRSIPHPVLGFYGWKAKVVDLCCTAVHYILKLLGISKRWLYRQCAAAGKMSENEETEYIGFLWDTFPFSSNIRREDLYPLQELPFEHLTLSFPKCLHEQLTAFYGDYMQLPPVEKRKNHYPYQLEFGDE